MDLAHLERCYAALSPTTPSLIPCFPDPKLLSRPESQRFLAENLSQYDIADDSEGSKTWKKVFWRRVVKTIEAGFEQRRQEGQSIEDEEVDERILEQVVRHMSSDRALSAPSSIRRMYFWGPLSERKGWKSVTTLEEGRMISGGTTGLRTWQACICLSNHLIAQPSILEEALDVLELGAGVGLLSLVAGCLAPSCRITASDVDDRVLEQLARNVELNELSDNVTTSRLDWEICGSKQQQQQQQHSAIPSPALILGADIVYDPTLAGHLAATLSAMLTRTRSDGRTPIALIAGTIRNETTWDLFLSECKERGLRIEPVAMCAPPDGGGIVGAEGWEGEGEVRLVRIWDARA